MRLHNLAKEDSAQLSFPLTLSIALTLNSHSIGKEALLNPHLNSLSQCYIKRNDGFTGEAFEGEGL